jgi:hypothetical protein
MRPEQLFVFGAGGVSTALQVGPRDENWDAFRDAPPLWRAEMLPSEPVVFDYDLGRSPTDVISTGHGDKLLLLSDRMIAALRNEGFTGWTVYPVEVYRGRGRRVDGYQGFAVTGRCNATGAEVLRQGLTPDIWDGSDLFLLEDASACIVVDRVKEALEAKKLQNVRFTPFVERNWSWEPPEPEPLSWPGGQLAGAILYQLYLVNADLRGADLRGAIAGTADLTGANLSDADLRGADFLDADLTDSILTGARYDRHVRLAT